jgi:hypothetical protein
MDILAAPKTCRKGLHQYSADLKQCPECRRKSKRHWRKQNPERNREYTRRWTEQNPERKKESERRWRAQNSERKNKSRRLWREQNPERKKESERHWRAQNSERDKENHRRWYEQNPGKRNAYAAKRRSAERQAIAHWADLDAIKQIYAEAAELTKSTGIRHEVDHIYPLQSEYMCGLHVETNLQILTQSENASKKNRTWPGQLDCQKDLNPRFLTEI